MVIGLDIENHKYKTSTKGCLVYIDSALNTIEAYDKLQSYSNVKLVTLSALARSVTIYEMYGYDTFFFAHNFSFYLTYLLFKYYKIV